VAADNDAVADAAAALLIERRDGIGRLDFVSGLSEWTRAGDLLDSTRLVYEPSNQESRGNEKC
jgi:hypothetical protein